MEPQSDQVLQQRLTKVKDALSSDEADNIPVQVRRLSHMEWGNGTLKRDAGQSSMDFGAWGNK